MKRMMTVAIAVLIACGCGAPQVRAQTISASDVFDKVGKAYSGLKEYRMEMAMGMEMLGSTMTMSGVLQKKGDKARMEMEIPVPASSTKMTVITVMDGAKVTSYQPMMKTAFVINTEKLPEELRKMMQAQSSPMQAGDEMIKALAASGITPTVKKQTKDGRDFWVIQIDDVSKMNEKLQPAVRNNGFVKKGLFWVDCSTCLVSRIEFFSPEDKPAMWMEFKNLKAQAIPDDTFVLKLPDDVKVTDVTDSMLQMMSSQPASDVATTETKRK